MTSQLCIHNNDQTLQCEGSLNLSTADELRSVLVRTDDLDTCLDLAGIGECDVSGIQLLYAAAQCAKAQGKRFSILAISPQVETISAAIGLSLTPFCDLELVACITQ